MTKSDVSKRGLTNTLKAQLAFYRKNLAEKQKTLIATQKFKKYNLPGYATMEKQELKGIEKVKTDLFDLKARIILRQRYGEIFKIL